MSLPRGTVTLAQREAAVNARCPGWHAWATQPSHGPVTWSARPDGATAAVITGAVSGDHVFARIAEYERDLDRHLQETRGRLAACEMSNIGRDEAAQLQALVTALENLSAQLTATGNGA